MQALWQVGPSRVEQMAELPITWAELAAYATASEVNFERWELRAIMEMSRAYVAAKSDGKDPLSIAPVDRDAENG